MLKNISMREKTLKRMMTEMNNLEITMDTMNIVTTRPTKTTKITRIDKSRNIIINTKTPHVQWGVFVSHNASVYGWYSIMITKKNTKVNGAYFLERLWEESWTYIKTVVDVVREPVLILDKNFCISAANEPFCDIFKVKPEETENKKLYEIGNGQWNIKALRNLLEDILPKHTFFKGFEVSHNFPQIGQKIMILNARQIHFKMRDDVSRMYPPIILLAIEDVTDMMDVAEMLARHTNEFEAKMSNRTHGLEKQILDLETEVNKLKKK